MASDYNNVNLQYQFLKIYLNSASNEELIEINTLLQQKKYDLIFNKIDEYRKKIIYNKSYKDVSPSGDSGVGSNHVLTELDEKTFSTEEMDSQTFELYCILVLIDKYLHEKELNKKRLFEEEINNALYYYRLHEKETNKKL